MGTTTPKNTFKKIKKYSIALTAMSLFLLAFSQIAFHIWVGDKIIVPWSLAVVMTAYFICNIWITPYKNFLNGMGKMSVTVVISFFKIVLFFPVAIALIKLWSSMGLVIAILVVNTLPNMVFGIYQYSLIINHKATGIWNR